VNDACDVTLSVNPHRASLKNMPGKNISISKELDSVPKHLILEPT
jgi:hypothetical protein